MGYVAWSVHVTKEICTYKILISKCYGIDCVRNNECVNLEMRKLVFKFHLIVYEKHVSCVSRKRIKLLNRQHFVENKTEIIQ
jgi:hypothetical protein